MFKLYNKYSNFIESISLYFFLVAIVLFRIPNFYFAPLDNAFLTTQAVARVLIVFVFLIKILGFLPNGKKALSNHDTKTVTLLIVIFFTVQSLSIFSAVNYYSFLIRYKDVILGLLAFFCFYFYKDKYKKIALALILPFAFNIFYQAFMLIDKNTFISFASSLIYKKHLSFVLYDLERGRLFIDSYDEAFVPLLLLNGLVKSPFVSYLLLIPTAFLSFISNYRTRVLMFFFSFLSSSVILNKVKSFRIVLLLASIVITAYIVNLVSFNISGFSFYDRFLLQDKYSDIFTIDSRIIQISKALEIGLVSPFGVGLGNYYDNLGHSGLKSAAYYTLPDDVREGAEGYVHNIFGSVVAESGYLSLVVFMAILAIFIKDDITTLKKKDKYKSAFAICFWSLFIHAFFNPNAAGSYQFFFWGLRGILLK